MKQQFYLLVKASALMLTVICLQSFFHKGGDYYKVLLNGKMMAEQYLTKPVSLKTMSLNTANRNDQLTVYYSHCGQSGKSRTITLKNEEGKILKEWKFADSKSLEMALPVREVLQASAKVNAASVYYASREIPSGRQLINLNLSTALAGK